MLSRTIAFLWAGCGKIICANSVQCHGLVQKVCKLKTLAGTCANSVQVFWPAVASGLCPIQPDQPNARPAQRSARETLFWRESSELCHFILFLACGSRFLAIHGRGREWLHRARAYMGNKPVPVHRAVEMLHYMTFRAGQRATDTTGGILGAWRWGRCIRYMPVGGFSKKDLFQKKQKKLTPTSKPHSDGINCFHEHRKASWILIAVVKRMLSWPASTFCKFRVLMLASSASLSCVNPRAFRSRRTFAPKIFSRADSCLLIGTIHYIVLMPAR